MTCQAGPFGAGVLGRLEGGGETQQMLEFPRAEGTLLEEAPVAKVVVLALERWIALDQTAHAV